jgi:hypothetical protein
MKTRCIQIVEVSKNNAKNRMWLCTIVGLQSIALLDELMVKLEIYDRVQQGHYFHNGHSSYVKFAYVYNVVVLIIN